MLRTDVTAVICSSPILMTFVFTFFRMETEPRTMKLVFETLSLSRFLFIHGAEQCRIQACIGFHAS